jgi:hypothetical protein
MKEITVTTSTKVDGTEFSYDVPVKQYETVEEMRDDLGEDKVLYIVNRKRRQDTAQGTKGIVRDALENHAPDSDEVAEAVAKAQKASRNYGFGKGPSGGQSGGITKKAQTALGGKIAEYFVEHGKAPTQAEQMEMMAELGIG